MICISKQKIMILNQQYQTITIAIDNNQLLNYMTNNLQRYSSYWSYFSKIAKNGNTIASKPIQYNQQIQNYYLKSGLSLGNLIAQRPGIDYPIFKHKRSLQFLQQNVSTQNVLTKDNENSCEFWAEVKHQQWFARVLYYFLLHYLFESSGNFDSAKKQSIIKKWKSIVHKLETDSVHDFVSLNCWKSNLISISDAKIYFIKFLKVLAKNSSNTTENKHISKGYTLQQINISPKIDPIFIYIIKASARETVQNYKDLSLKNAVDFLKVLGFQKVTCQQDFKQQKDKQNFLIKLQANDFILKARSCEDRDKRNRNKTGSKSQFNNIEFSIQQPALAVSQFCDSQIEFLDVCQLEFKITESKQQRQQQKCLQQGRNPQQFANIRQARGSLGVQSDEMAESLQYRDTVDRQVMQNSSKSSLRSPNSPFMKRIPDFMKKLPLNRKDTIMSEGVDSQLGDSIVIPMVANMIVQNFLNSPGNKVESIPQHSCQQSLNVSPPKIRVHFSKESELVESQQYQVNKQIQVRADRIQSLQSNSDLQKSGESQDECQIVRHMTGSSELNRFQSNKDSDLQRQINNVMKADETPGLMMLQKLRNMTLDQRKRQPRVAALLLQQNESQRSRKSQKGKHPYIGKMNEIQFCKSEDEIKICFPDHQNLQKKSNKSKKLNQMLQIPDLKNIKNVVKKNRRYSEKINFNSPQKEVFGENVYLTPIQAIKQAKLRKISTEDNNLSLDRIYNSKRAKTAKVQSIQHNSSQKDRRITQFQHKNSTKMIIKNQNRPANYNQIKTLNIGDNQHSGNNSFQYYQSKGFQSPQQKVHQQSFGFASQRIYLTNGFPKQSNQNQHNHFTPIITPQNQIYHPNIYIQNVLENQATFSSTSNIKKQNFESKQNRLPTQINCSQINVESMNRNRNTIVNNNKINHINQNPQPEVSRSFQNAQKALNNYQNMNFIHQTANRSSLPVYLFNPSAQRNSLSNMMPQIKQKQAVTSQNIFSDRIQTSFKKPINHYKKHQLGANCAMINHQQHQQTNFTRSNHNTLHEKIDQNHQTNQYPNNFKAPVYDSVGSGNIYDKKQQFKAKSQIYGNYTTFNTNKKITSHKQLNATMLVDHNHIQRNQKGKISLKGYGHNKKHVQNRKTNQAINTQYRNHISPQINTKTVSNPTIPIHKKNF